MDCGPYPLSPLQAIEYRPNIRGFHIRVKIEVPIFRLYTPPYVAFFDHSRSLYVSHVYLRLICTRYTISNTHMCMKLTVRCVFTAEIQY